jgi:hypothetical protein
MSKNYARLSVRVAAFVLFAGLLSAAELRVGAAKRVITPDLQKFSPVYIAGFGQNRVATGVHDDLFARCIAIVGGTEPLVICGVDSVGLFWADVKKVRERAGVRVVVASLHDHEAPDTMGLWGPKMGVSGIDNAYNQFVVEQTADAAKEAVQAAKPATLRLATVKHPDLDGFIADNRPPVVHDSDLIVLNAKDRQGKTIVTMVNWANHPETLADRNTLLTADYPAYFYTRLEERLGGIAVFVNGAVGGMQSSLNAKIKDPDTGEAAPARSFRKAELIGRRVADLAADAVAKAKPVKIRSVEYREKPVQIPAANPKYQAMAKFDLTKGRTRAMSNGEMTSLVGLIRLRPALEIALIPGELYPELSVGGVERYSGADFPDAPIEPAIKQSMKAPHRMLFGLANDEVGYIIPKAEWDAKAPWLQDAKKAWYGEVNSPGPETAPRIVGAIIELIKEK